MSRSQWLGSNHNNRFWRFLLVLVAALTLLLLQTPEVFAAESNAIDAEAEAATALDVLCVNGLVINHEEVPLEGWTVVATFAEDLGAYGPFTAVSDDEGAFRFDLPAPGLWSFAIELPEGWEAVTESSFVVNVTYGSTECRQIRFKVEQVVKVIVIKIDDDHNPLAGWIIWAKPGPGNSFAEEQSATTDDQGIATFELTPGLWLFSEEAPDGLDWWEPVIPPDGVQELDVKAPGPYTIRFKNRLERGKGCIEVIKKDVPPDTQGDQGQSFGLPDWPIEVYRADGSLAASGQTDAFGRIVFNGLPFGPYTVREIMLPGWQPASPTAYEVVLTRADASCQVIEFVNRQDVGFCIEGRKLDANGNYGIPGWEIDAKPLNPGGFDPDPVVTDGQGYYRIDFPLDDYRIPGSPYEVRERVRRGWTPASPTSYVVTLPWHAGACITVPDFTNRQTRREEPGANGDDPPNGNPGKDHYRPEQPGNPGACSAYHVVRPGESIYSIAPHYGLSGPALMRANPWVRHQRHNWLYVGQKVCIP